MRDPEEKGEIKIEVILSYIVGIIYALTMLLNVLWGACMIARFVLCVVPGKRGCKCDRCPMRWMCDRAAMSHREYEAYKKGLEELRIMLQEYEKQRKGVECGKGY